MYVYDYNIEKYLRNNEVYSTFLQRKTNRLHTKSKKQNSQNGQFQTNIYIDQDTSRGVCLMEHTSFEISFVKYN